MVNERHFFLCALPTKPKCCKPDLGEPAWNYLKKRVSELQLENTGVRIHRTNADCLRVCEKGPIAVIYPDRVWYQDCTSENIEKILQEHLLGGSIVEELQIDPPLD